MESGDVAGWEAGAFTRLNALPLTRQKSGRSFRRTQQAGRIMAKRKDTKAAQAAIDDAQAALAAAEAALGNKPENADPEAEDAPQGAPDVSDIADATYAAIATYDQPEPAKDLAPGRTVTFTVADALTHLGTDAQFASSHAIHRTMIAVSYHDDGGVSVGSYVAPQERAHEFDRDDAGRMAVAHLRKV